MNNTGIYIIKNKINGKIYIGSSINISGRFSMHKYSLRKNKHHSQHLQKSWNKYGENNFEFIIHFLCSKNELIINEQKFIDLYKSFDHKFGYNISPTANSPLGIKRTEAQRKRMSEIKKLNPSRYWLNKTFSDIHKRNIGLKSLGRGLNKHNGSVETLKPDGIITKDIMYRSRIWHNRKRWNLGCYETRDQAESILEEILNIRNLISYNSFENFLLSISENNKNKKSHKMRSEYILTV